MTEKDPFQYDTGVIHGRFQVLHNDHVNYLMAGKALCRHLVVGITNPDPLLSRMEDADSDRSQPLANPLTYYERFLLVRAALEGEGVGLNQFTVVPFPISFPDLYRQYVPMDAVFFLTIYDEWGKKKLSYFQQQGVKTHVLWEVPPEKKGISANDVRKLMMENMPWEHLTPPHVAALIHEWGISERLKRIEQSIIS